jgi:hypothetical protein
MRPPLLRHALVSLVLLAGAAACRKDPIMTDNPTPPAADPPAAAAAPTASTQAGLELAISASGTVVHVVLRNVGPTALRLFGPVAGPDRRHHDFLRAELAAGAERRVLRFTGNRNASTTGLVELPPHGEITDDLDLAIWATQTINGGKPLASGDHEVTLTYELAQPGVWNGRVTAGPVAIHVP